jgi:16S rRNA (cytosine967-C5)-methyltransferase
MIAPARRAALDALLAIEASRADPGSAVAAGRGGLSDERDRALMLELVTGTLRMRAAIDFQLASRVSRPLRRLDAAVLAILRLGAYQLLYLSRVPVSAVTSDGVELARCVGKSSAAGLVNAVLRGLARDRDRKRIVWPPRPPSLATSEDRERLVTYLATVHSHPAWLVARWLARYGPESAEAWLAFNNRAPALCLAPNRSLNDRTALAELLASQGVAIRPSERSRHGLVVERGAGAHAVFQTTAYREGRVVIQDEASQLVVDVMEAQADWRVLDLCASPGGKTIALAADTGHKGRVVACDVRPHRLRLLVRTLARCRASRVSVVHIAEDGPLPFGDASFDGVLIDAPCSGLGTLRRDPDIRWRRDASDLAGLAEGQLALLTRAAPVVRFGGTLVYSTCSSEPEENEHVVSGFLLTHPHFVLRRVHETLPFRDGLEAFFAAVLVRT